MKLTSFTCSHMSAQKFEKWLNNERIQKTARGDFNTHHIITITENNSASFRKKLLSTLKKIETMVLTNILHEEFRKFCLICWILGIYIFFDFLKIKTYLYFNQLNMVLTMYVDVLLLFGTININIYAIQLAEYQDNTE